MGFPLPRKCFIFFLISSLKCSLVCYQSAKLAKLMTLVQIDKNEHALVTGYNFKVLMLMWPTRHIGNEQTKRSLHRAGVVFPSLTTGAIGNWNTLTLTFDRARTLQPGTYSAKRITFAFPYVGAVSCQWNVWTRHLRIVMEIPDWRKELKNGWICLYDPLHEVARNRK